FQLLPEPPFILLNYLDIGVYSDHRKMAVDIGTEEKRERLAFRLFNISLIWKQMQKVQVIRVEAPQLGNPHARVELLLVERTARDVDFDRQIGRRVDGEIGLALLQHA